MKERTFRCRFTMGGPDAFLRAVFLEKPLHESELPHNYWHLTLMMMVLVVISFHWLWWKRRVWRLRTIPTSNKSHFLMACIITASAFKNKTADSSVIFFQLLCGLAKVHQLLKLGLFYMWFGFRPVVVCFNAETFEAILKSSTNLRKSFDYSFLSLWLKEGLVTSEGAKWKQRRKTITSAFHFRILEDFIPVFDDQSRVMIKQLKKVNDLKCIDIVPYVTMCTLDIICETAMGIRINAQEDHSSSYVKTMHRTSEAFVSRILRPWLWPDCVYFATAKGKEFRRNAAKMDDFTREVIQNRKKEIQAKKGAESGDEVNESKEKKKKAFLDLLLDLHLAGKENLNEGAVQEEVDSFMFAGHDTTAVGISWVLYMLGLYPDIQRKVQEEVDALFGEDVERPVVEEDLKELKYLECVIKETQRVYPAAPYIARQLLEDVHFGGGCTIPKGSTCMLMMYMLHRDEEFFPNAEVFDPDRFLPERCIGRHPFSYCPFSAGPRSCIGQKFAFLEEKTVIANFMRHFTVKSIDPRDKLLLAAEMVLRSRHGIRLELKPRK